MVNLWERQASESYPAYEAFREFLTTPERSYSKVAERLSKSTTLIKRWAKQNRWRERADAWDNEVSRKAMEKAADDFAAMIERQINISRMFQARGANAIQQMDLTNLPPRFLPALIELVKVGANLERSARELKQDKPQENLFIKTMTKIWTGDADD
ncbi:MAG: hypothetical protein IKJ07_00125 [Clostridia bacterium]|nr:hypothetical protein [Clostridia bacterium]